MTTNIVSTAIYWNIIGSLFSMFIFLFDGVLPVVSGDGNVSLMGLSCIPDSVMWTLSAFLYILVGGVSAGFALAAHRMPNDWGDTNKLYGFCYVFYPLVFFVITVVVVVFQQRNPEITVLQMGSGHAGTAAAVVDPYPIRKSMVYWTAYAMVTPFVAQVGVHR